MSQRATRLATTCISRGSASRLHHAFRFMDEVTGRSASGQELTEISHLLGVDLTMFVTINFGATESGHDLFDELRRDRFLPWLRRAAAKMGVQISPTHIWVRENVGGLHVHWALHVPAALIDEFRDLLPRWITSLEERTPGKKRRSSSFAPASGTVVRIQKVTNSVGLRRYFLKGVASAWAAQFGVKAKPQGVITKRRSGYSRNLCPSARKRAGYRSGPVPSRVNPLHRARRLARYGHLVPSSSILSEPGHRSVSQAAAPCAPASKAGANTAGST